MALHPPELHSLAVGGGRLPGIKVNYVVPKLLEHELEQLYNYITEENTFTKVIRQGSCWLKRS